MNQQTFQNMNETEFDQLIDGYIERIETKDDNMELPVFFDLLLERIAANAEKTLNLAVALSNDEIVITPDREMNDIVVRGNEILVGGRRLIFQLRKHSDTEKSILSPMLP
jgi:hypothetical protein